MAIIPGQYPLAKAESISFSTKLDAPKWAQWYLRRRADIQIQLPGPFKFRINEPPSNVILDDRAVYEVLQSNIPRAQLSKRWSHDFSGQAAVRHRRAHCGRPAYKEEEADDESGKYQSFKPSGKNAPLYLFSGEKDYEPVFYHDLPPAEETPEPEAELDDTPAKPKQHNQYTAPELLVRNGAQSASLTKGKYRPRVNTFLRRSPSPPWVKDRKRLFGGVGIGRTAANAPSNTATSSNFDFSFAPAPSLTGAPAAGQSMWVEQDEEMLVEDQENEIQPSIFDAPAVQRSTEETGNTGGAGTQGPSSTSLKRPALSDLFSARPKATRREMGYIERLAAGLLREEVEAVTAVQPMADADLMGVGDQDRVERLERELEAANSALRGRDGEIADLKSQLEEMQTQLAMRQSVDGY